MQLIVDRFSSVSLILRKEGLSRQTDAFGVSFSISSKGAFPTWLAPVQVNLLPVNNDYHLEYAKELLAKFREAGLRTELDDSNDKLGYRMRSSQMKKIPYTLVLGDHERDDRTVTYRRFGVQEQITVSIDEFLKLISDEIKNKALLNTENK